MVTLKLFGDESADATKSRVFAVAGVIGSESEWTLAEAVNGQNWRQAISR